MFRSMSCASADEDTIGWTARRTAAIRARYVNEERVIIHLAERLSA